MKILMDQNFNVNVFLNSTESVAGNDIMVPDGSEMMGEVSGDPQVKDPLLSSWPFVIGISTVSLAVSIVLGILLARRKIKKGFELYED